MIRSLMKGAACSTVVFLLAATCPAWAHENDGDPADTTDSTELATDTEAPASDADLGEADEDTTIQPTGDETPAPESGTDDAATPDDTSNDDTSNNGASNDTPTEAPSPDGPVTADEQDVTITDIDVAVATSGDNTITDTTDQAPVDDGPADTDIDTGEAVAVGSQDSTAVEQSVDTVLSGDAHANVTQIVFVFNIGAASANTGSNGSATPATGGGNASISTGDATAVGQSGATYVTQGGTATASGTGTDTSSQLSVTVRIGVAIAGSGGNNIIGGTGNGSATSTGNATAIGNNSTTDITQSATANGSGSSNITIEQQAIVINVGIAMANSGLNGVSELTAELLAMPDQQIAEQLFAVLLPALLGSYLGGSGGTGAGTVATGDATAVGNWTQTFVDQNAVATASGDGTATLQQQVVVANIGAAVANTGINQSGTATTALDASQQQLVVQLAAFLTGLLAAAQAWQPGDELPGLDGLSLPNGDLLIGINGSLSGSLLDVSSGDGPSATIRQVVAVVSLGVSSANSGQNQSVIVGLTDDGSLVLTAGPSIVTGDATAINNATIIVCQLSDAPQYPCLAPDVGSSGPVVGGVSGGSDGGMLPVTGSGVGAVVWTAALVLLAGLALHQIGRRREEAV